MGEGLSRRELLQRGAIGGAALAGAGALAWAGAGRAGDGPRIVIVGAGLAGLSCAYRLQGRGLVSTVYEANPDRIGGRAWTARDFSSGQTAEHGGEFLDSRHVRMRALAERFGFELIDLFAQPNPGTSRWWLKGERRRVVRGRREWAVFERRINDAARRAGGYGFNDASRAAEVFDEITAAEWLDLFLPGGSRGVVGRLIWAELASEFGLDADRLSAINLFRQYVDDPAGADERYAVRGGVDQIPHALAAALPDGTVRPGAALEALYARSDGSYGLRFGGVAEDVVADQVVLALPFTTLREVDLTKAGLPPKRRACINTLGMGTNAKLLMQFDRRPQRYGRWNGFLTSDDPFLLTWESTLGQRGRNSVVTTFFGGRSGAGGLPSSGPHAPTVEREVRRNLVSLSERGGTGITGIAGGFTGEAWTDRWVGDPWARGSYAAYLPGQYTRYYRYVGRPEGAINFAGEHTVATNQGYLEGAVRSGERAADRIARKTGG